MNKQPFFSIVIPTFNRLEDLRFALFCLYQQTFKDFEVIISDNSSTDEAKEMLKDFPALKFRYHRNSKNIGLTGNQILATTYARGKYVFLHGDDDFLVYRTSLFEFHKILLQHKLGFLRLNYASVYRDKHIIFNFQVNKPHSNDIFFSAKQENTKILSFLVDSDMYFFTGIIYKNKLPSHVRMIYSDPSPWVNILFYVVRKYGGYFLSKRHILARWSRRIKLNEDHGYYIPVKGRLKQENYFNAVKKIISLEKYKEFIVKEFDIIYLSLLPIVKLRVGNRILIKIFRRLCVLDSRVKLRPATWIKLGISLFLPVFALKIIREIYFPLYMSRHMVADKSLNNNYKKLLVSYKTFKNSLHEK